MKVFLDTNIVIDFYDQRGDFYYPAAVIFDLAYQGKNSAFCFCYNICQCIFYFAQILFP